MTSPLTRFRLRHPIALLIACLFFFSPLMQAETPLSIDEQSAILRDFFAVNLDDPNALAKALPKAWLEANADLNEARKTAEAKLLALRNRDEINDEQQSEIELLVLQIQWLRLSPQARAKQLAEINSREIAVNNERKGAQLITQARQESAQATVVQTELTAQAEITLDERKANLLKQRLALEAQKQALATAKQQMGEIQFSFAERFNQWKTLESEIYQAIEASSQDYLQYRPRLRQLLRESNARIATRERFEQYALPTSIADKIEGVDRIDVTARSGDSEDVKQLVQDIYQASINLATAYELFQRERETLLVQQIKWEKDYRKNLLITRGKIIERIKQFPFSYDSSEPLLQEGRTILNDIRLVVWSFETLYIKANTTNDRTLLQTLSRYANLGQLLIFFALTVLLLIKKNIVLTQINKFLQRWLSKRFSRWKNMTIELLEGLYIFLVLLLLGSLIIQFGLELGFDFLSVFSPLLVIALYFFLGWGFVDFLRPIISQRRFRNAINSSNHEESRAIEDIFETIPKLILLYLLIDALSYRLLYDWLNENFLSDTLTTTYQIAFILVLLAWVWQNRIQWRLVAHKAVETPWLDRMIDRSSDKLWEPLVLIFAGGLGVYRVAWYLFKARIGELAFARSFQAMLSRALLERRQRNSTVRVVQERFPIGYLNDFNYETRAHPEWHVERREASEHLNIAHQRWQEEKFGTTTLLVGDRGVGKSELIYQFLREHQIQAIECKLQPGDITLNQVLITLSKQLFASPPLDINEFRSQLLELPPNVILLENLENAILRQIDGFDTFTTIIDLVMATSGHHLWLVTFTTYAWTIAKRAVPGADCFSQYLFLHGMNETEIKQLVLRRHQGKPKLKLNFSNLSLEVNKHPQKKLSQQENEARRQNLYFRILWDYTGGNPRQALYFWKTSLEFTDGEAKVNLFEIPEQNVLEQLRDKSLMLLAALVEHNGLTLPGLSKVMNEPQNNIRRWIEELAPYKILYSFGEAGQDNYGWHIESFWIKTVETYLVKRQLLFRGGLK